MATTNSVTLTLGYTGTDFTRNYKIGGVSEAALYNVKTKIRVLVKKNCNAKGYTKRF